MTTPKGIFSNSKGKLIILGAMLVSFAFLSSAVVVAQATAESEVSAQAFVQSRFVLWDVKEKMVDKNFDIAMFSWNNTSCSYNIQIDSLYYNGTFFQYKSVNISYNRSIISVLNVKINNITVLAASNIRVTTGITQTGIEQTEAFKISFLPFELTKYEWNLVFSGLVGVFISLPTAYYTVKFYRRYRGAQEM